MPHFKAPDNSVHFIEGESFAHLLPAGCVPITDAEAQALRTPPPVNCRPEVVAEFKQLTRPAVVDALDGIANRAFRAGDSEFASALDALAVKVIALDGHPLFAAAPDTDGAALRVALKQAYAAEVMAVLAPVAAVNPAKAAAWKAAVDKVMPK